MQEGNDKVKLTRRGCNIIYTVTEGRGWGGWGGGGGGGGG